jgi:hypothetical protein
VDATTHLSRDRKLLVYLLIEFLRALILGTIFNSFEVIIVRTPSRQDPPRATAITILMTSTIVTQVFAIKYFFNCMTDSANRHGKLTLDDIHMCLYKKYSKYRNLPYDTFIHSSRGGGNNGRGH